MRSRVLGLVWVAALATLTSAPSAQASGLTILSQSRVVEAAALATDGETMDGQADSRFAPDNGLFHAPLSVSAIKGTATASASAEQNSSLSSFAIQGTGSHSSTADDTGAAGSSFARGGSEIFVRFQVDQPRGYTLHGFVETSDMGSATLVLRDDTQEIAAFASIGNDHVDFDAPGTLAAGIYELDIDTSGSSSALPFQPQSSSGAFDVALILQSATDAPHVASILPVAFPNPFRAQTRIRVPSRAGDVSVFDLGGRLVRSWKDVTSVQWDGKDAAGLELPAGVYFLRVAGLPGADAVKLVRVH